MDPIIIQHYKDYNNVYYEGSLGWFQRWTHKALEMNSRHESRSIVLDIGGGDGQHVKYLNGQFEKYFILDLLDHSRNLNPEIESADLKKIKFIVGDAEQIPFPDNSIDRIILTCILHHVDTPSKVLNECRRVLRNKGKISIFLPNDPGMIYRWIRHFGAHRKYAKRTHRKIHEIKYLWAIEHKNHVLGLSTIVNEIFNADEIRRRSFPFLIGSWNFNLFQIFQINVSKTEKI